MTPGKGQSPRRGNPRGGRGKNIGAGRGGHNRRGPTPFPWDAVQFDQRITENFNKVATTVAEAALDGLRPTSELVRGWHAASLKNVPLAEPWVAGRYRGQGPPNSRLFSSQNHVNGVYGAPPARVRGEVASTFTELDNRLDALDVQIATGESIEALYDQVLATCAWLHGQWVRIHPFADHNGSTARMLAVMVGLRYGIPLNLPGKPRSKMPTAGLVLDYNLASANQMSKDDKLMEQFLHDIATETVQQAAAASGVTPDPAPSDAADEHGMG